MNVAAGLEVSGTPARSAIPRPRLGFLGVGWIGRQRLEAIARSGLAEIVALADVNSELASQAAQLLPETEVVGSLRELLMLDLDGVVVATPSALHAEQVIAALEEGVAVFCQKPLGRNAKEVQHIITAAREADLLLGVDLSYRFISQFQAIRSLVRQKELGEIFVADLTFHNAYGPDKPWFYDRSLAGGGCVIDLGIHLVDLVLWVLDFPGVTNVASRLFSQGRPLSTTSRQVEDFAMARLDLENGTAVQLSCSWKLPAGCDAIISAAFYGTKGGAMVHNIDGSFYHFVAERNCATRRETIAAPVEDWGGKAAIDWVARLSRSRCFDPEVTKQIQVAEALEAICSPRAHPL